jgi:hypothetical protein
MHPSDILLWKENWPIGRPILTGHKININIQKYVHAESRI